VAYSSQMCRLSIIAALLKVVASTGIKEKTSEHLCHESAAVKVSLRLHNVHRGEYAEVMFLLQQHLEKNQDNV